MSIRKGLGYQYTGSLLAVIGIIFLLLFFAFTALQAGDAGVGRLLANPYVLFTIAGMILGWPVFTLFYFRRPSQMGLNEYINRSALRFILAFLMFFYGYGKMQHKFFDITYWSQDARLADIDGLSATWYFYGRSNVQEFLIGLMELVPAVMLLFRRTAFAGMLLMLPVALNVMMVNLFNHLSPITYLLSIFIASANSYLLYGHRQAIKSLLAQVKEQPRPVLAAPLKAVRILFKGFVAGFILLIAIGPLTSALRKNHKRFVQHNKFKGGFGLYELKVGDSVVQPAQGDSRYYKDIYLEPQSRWNCVKTYTQAFHLNALTVLWNSNNDSVHTFLKTRNDVASDALDSSTAFAGTYTLLGDTLIISGTQYGTPIYARYYKKPLKDYDWFW